MDFITALSTTFILALIVVTIAVVVWGCVRFINPLTERIFDDEID